MSNQPPPAPDRGARMEAYFEAMNANLQDIARHTNSIATMTAWVVGLLVVVILMLAYALFQDDGGFAVRIVESSF